MTRTRQRNWSRSRRPSSALILTLSALLPIGCREELGPVPRPTATVAGRVLLDGQPISRGWVEFLPVEGTVGNLRSAKIGPDGTFQADRVAVGTNALRLVGAPLPHALVDRFGQRYSIRQSVPASGVSDLVIDLREESYRSTL